MQHFLANGEYVSIREAVPEEAADILSFFKVAVRETSFFMTTPTEVERFSEEKLSSCIFQHRESVCSLWLVAQTERGVVGSLCLTPSDKERQKHVADLCVAVLSSHWNLGIARRLMHHLMRWLELQTDIRRIQSAVMAHNEKALRLLKKFGLQEEGKQPGSVFLDRDFYGDLILLGMEI